MLVEKNLYVIKNSCSTETNVIIFVYKLLYIVMKGTDIIADKEMLASGVFCTKGNHIAFGMHVCRKGHFVVCIVHSIHSSGFITEREL